MTKSSKSNITLPAWLDAVRQPDEMQAAAYEDCPPDFRASLKTAIAFAFHLWGESASRFHTRLENPHSGFVHTLSGRPAAWTLAILSPDYISPARFIAAILPAILAGVENILIVSMDAAPSPALCAAAELAGLEDIFILPSCTDDAPRLLRELYEQNPDGRVLLFPPLTKRESGLSAVRQTADILKLHLWQDETAPRLSIIPSLFPLLTKTVRAKKMSMHSDKTSSPGHTEMRKSPRMMNVILPLALRRSMLTEFREMRRTHPLLFPSGLVWKAAGYTLS